MHAGDERSEGFKERPVKEPPMAEVCPDGNGSASPTSLAPLDGKLVQGRFRILARLGAGGMGEVYRADDLKLRRPVALKRLPLRLRSEECFRNSLLREARRASCLTDPRIAQVYDVLEEDSEAFLVMEYVEGITLRQRIKTPLSTLEFLDLAIQCAEALAIAHRQGVLHCDIKPENIMLTPAGQVKILDFGLAQRVPSQDAETTTRSAEFPKLAGTPGYMAPEVLAGHKPDARSDIYSLGVTFHEASGGKRPGRFGNPDSTTTDSALAVRPAPPQPIDAVIGKMRHPDREQRYSSAEVLLHELRSLQKLRPWEPNPPHPLFILSGRRAAIAAGVVFLLAAFAYVVGPRINRYIQQRLHPVPAQKQVAVLPFSFAGEDASTKAFADGISEVLSAKLTQLTERPQFQVIPISEVRARHVATASDARKEFGVNLVIEGTWQQAGGTIHVMPVLVDAAANRQLRASEFIAASSDPIGLEAQVANGVLKMLDIELQPAERQEMAKQGTTEPDAYAFYLRGRGYLEEFQKPENVESAISVFGSALKQDPHFGLAYAGLGEAYWRKYEHTADSQWVAKARESCSKSSALGNAGAAGYVCLGIVDNGTGRFQEAAEQFRKALTLEPARDNSFVGLGSAYEGLGQMDDAEQTYQKAIALHPQCTACYNNLGWFYYRRARFSDAIRLFSQVVEISPDSYIGYSNLGGTYVDAGNYAVAVPALLHSLAIRPTYQAYSNLGTAYFFQGKFAEAVDGYQRALQLNDRNYDVWGNLGDAYYWAPGRRAESAPAYRRAIALAMAQVQVNPNDAALLSYIAQYHAMLGEKSPALNYIGRALRLDPRSAEVALTAAIIYDQIGNVDSTFVMLSKAIKAGVPKSLIQSTPNFSNLAARARFRDLLQGKESFPGSDK
jgi:eukaryotic-like serine/threonine-protein kinase